VLETARLLAAALLAGLWLLQEVQVAGGAWPLITRLTLVLLVAYSAAAFVTSRTVLHIVAGLALAAAAALAMRFGMAASLLAGAHSGALFIAFLATMQMLKVAIESGSGLERLRRDHEALGAREQHDAMLLRSWLLAAIFAAGTLAIVAPLVSADRPAQDRCRLGQSALQGVGLALLWSPFFVAMAVCTRLSPGLTLGAALANGVAMGLLGIVVSHFAFGARLRIGAVKPLARVFAGSMAMAIVILLIHQVWGLGNSEAIVASVPLIALVLARKIVMASPRHFARRWLDALQAIAGEALLVSASLVLGEVMKDLIAQGVLRIPTSMAAWPEPLLILWPSLVMVVLSIAGFHPIIGATLLFPLQASLPALHPVVAGGTVLTGWMLSILLSRFAVPVMFAATMFGVGAPELVRGQGLRFGLLIAPVAWAWLWALNHLLPRALH
jgi:hypothetical protein